MTNQIVSVDQSKEIVSVLVQTIGFINHYISYFAFTFGTPAMAVKLP